MLTLATYNVHRCTGGDRRLDPARAAEVIRALGADVVALQEVAARHQAAGFLDQWAFLGAAIGYRCIPGISLRTGRKVFGNALLTRHPVRAVRLHDLAVPGREPRGAIDADLDLGGRGLRVIATHFGRRGAERRRQAERLLAILRADHSAVAAPCVATVLLGDLNEWRRAPNSISPVLDRFVDAPTPASFPARYPLLRLDRILSEGRLRLDRCRAEVSRIARVASDHLPIAAQFHWTAT